MESRKIVDLLPVRTRFLFSQKPFKFAVKRCLTSIPQRDVSKSRDLGRERRRYDPTSVTLVCLHDYGNKIIRGSRKGEGTEATEVLVEG